MEGIVLFFHAKFTRLSAAGQVEQPNMKVNTKSRYLFICCNPTRAGLIPLRTGQPIVAVAERTIRSGQASAIIIAKPFCPVPFNILLVLSHYP